MIFVLLMLFCLFRSLICFADLQLKTTNLDLKLFNMTAYASMRIIYIILYVSRLML
jgi:hypothetical protein